VVERLNAEFNKALAAPDVKAKLATLGVDPVGGTTAAFTQYVRNDVDRWAKIIKAAGVKIE
jgi:tripartite-type tricarboxylate transporter receptor subunit TctC